MAYTVTVGEKANCFHDASTGVTVCKGQKVTLRDSQYSSTKIRQALATGHLILIQEQSEVPMVSVNEIQKVDKRVRSQYKKGTTIEKLASDVSFEQAKALAKKYKVEVEENDTVVDILKAILEDGDEE